MMSTIIMEGGGGVQPRLRGRGGDAERGSMGKWVHIVVSKYGGIGVRVCQLQAIVIASDLCSHCELPGL